jgi:hypothetical protein
MTKVASRYKVAADSKLHTSFTELKRCTGVDSTLSVVRERLNEKRGFDGPVVQFGRDRHEMWHEQSLQTGRIPKEFAHLFDAPVDYAEHAFATEVFKDVVLHFRPDAVSLEAKAVIDYKKIVGDAKQFNPSKQLLIYAYGLWLHGIDIRERVYLCEQWDKDSTKILGYQIWRLPVKLIDLGQVPMWLKERVALLKTVNDSYGESND